MSLARLRSLASFAPIVSAFLVAACSADSSDAVSAEGNFSSNQATLLDFEFDAELLTDSVWSESQAIQDQLLYTIGHLNTDRSVGRLDKLTITNVVKTKEGGKTKLSYHAKLPVAWGSKTNLPTSYELVLPRDVSFAALTSFTEAHKESCVDWGAHDVDAGSMWYYFRPTKSGCAIDDSEVVKPVATITKSAENTTGKFPEYHKVWEDNALEVIAIFGKYEDGAKTASDAGIRAYNTFVSSTKRTFAQLGLSSTPANVSDAPGIETPDVEFNATLADGKTVKITALLVDNIGAAPRSFDARYEALSPKADLIAYNGHAGLGQNVRALARKGRFETGQYQIFFMNGCDTFAYVDGSLAETRAGLNPDDPTGTKYMEFVTNAMPSFFSSMSNASTAVIQGLLSYASPKTYDQIFENIDRSEVVLVTGEEDNVFTPGTPIGGKPDEGGGTGDTFAPIGEQGTVGQNEITKYVYDVPAGTFRIDLAGSGDADLYVRAGAEPTDAQFDCRPYENGSAESCVVTFEQAGKLFVNVVGYYGTSDYTLTGKKL